MKADVKITDCTLRDGGYVNDHDFTLTQVQHTVSHLLAAGVDLVEIGYYRRRDAPGGMTASCPDYLLDGLPRLFSGRLAVMLRPEQVKPDELGPLRDSAISHVRIPTRLERLEDGLNLARGAADLGLKVCFNLIRASELDHELLPAALDQIATLEPEVLILADSNGSMGPSRVAQLMAAVGRYSDTPLGFHAHDNLSLAIANSLVAINGGARWVDSTLGGLGKGGGNASTEVLLPLVASLTGRNISLENLLDVMSVYPRGLFPPRMLGRLQSAVFGLYNCNLEDIRALQDLRGDGASNLDELLSRLTATKSALDVYETV
jgi:4-hydroxy 2-oxovalerate aldolase